MKKQTNKDPREPEIHVNMLHAHAFLSSHKGTYITKTGERDHGPIQFFSLCKQRLVCEPCKARVSATPADKTKPCSFVDSCCYFLYIGCSACGKPTGTLCATILLAYAPKTDYLSFREHVFLGNNVSVEHRGQVSVDSA